MVILPRAKIDPPSLEFASHQRARGLVNRETTIAQSALPLLVLRPQETHVWVLQLHLRRKNTRVFPRSVQPRIKGRCVLLELELTDPSACDCHRSHLKGLLFPFSQLPLSSVPTVA